MVDVDHFSFLQILNVHVLEAYSSNVSRVRANENVQRALTFRVVRARIEVSLSCVFHARCVCREVGGVGQVFHADSIQELVRETVDRSRESSSVACSRTASPTGDTRQGHCARSVCREGC